MSRIAEYCRRMDDVRLELWFAVLRSSLPSHVRDGVLERVDTVRSDIDALRIEWGPVAIGDRTNGMDTNG
jgi:hypothetical protein